MGKQLKKITPRIADFIAKQPVFFTATAMADGRINLSPKGMDAFRVLDENRVMWLDLTGSGNETATHLRHLNRITIMFCAFDGPPMILRLYGTGKIYTPGDPAYEEHIGRFPEMPGVRQLFDIEVDLVQTSCGSGVPLMDFKAHRETLVEWAEEKGPAGIRDYWEEHNTKSLDGHPTGMKA